MNVLCKLTSEKKAFIHYEVFIHTCYEDNVKDYVKGY